MLMRLSVTLWLTTLLGTGHAVRAEEPDPLVVRCEALAVEQDDAGMVALWKEHPQRALQVIDSFLEGSLALVEAAEKTAQPVDAERLRHLHAVALRAARADDFARGGVLLGDYASAFVGWTRDQQRQFRAGQQAFGESRTELKQGNVAASRAAAQRCLDLARPLGDWWGVAMGLTAVAAADERLDANESALTHLAEARLIHHNLGLVGSEVRNLQGMARLLVVLGRLPRALRAIEQGLALAAMGTDPQAAIPFLEQRAGIEEQRNETEAAQRTRAEIEARKAITPKQE